jgi:hypothetical protein
MEVVRVMRSTVVAVLIMVSIGFGVWGILIWRASTSLHQQQSLCSVLYSVILTSDKSLGKPGTPGYFYYQLHPDEVKVAHRYNRRTLNELPCSP